VLVLLANAVLAQPGDRDETVEAEDLDEVALQELVREQREENEAAPAADRARASAESESDPIADPPPRTAASQATTMADLITLIREGPSVELLPAKDEAVPTFE
jgi:hypothetical protein